MQYHDRLSHTYTSTTQYSKFGGNVGTLVLVLVLRIGGPPETRFPQKAGPRYRSELRYHGSESKTGTDDGRTTVNQSHHNGDPSIPFGTPLGTNGIDPAWERHNRRRWRHMDPKPKGACRHRRRFWI